MKLCRFQIGSHQEENIVVPKDCPGAVQPEGRLGTLRNHVVAEKVP